MSGSSVTQAWLTASNVATSAAWLRAAIIALSAWFDENSTEESCLETVKNAANLALVCSLVEVFNSATGMTRAPLSSVVIFTCARSAVGLLIAPLIPCNCWQYILTCATWGVGDFCRFGCFAVNTAAPGFRMAKNIRFTVGPMLFPIGTSLEITMIVLAAADGRPLLYILAAIWPFGFFRMMTQLLKQRRKHFHPEDKKKEIKAV